MTPTAQRSVVTPTPAWFHTSGAVYGGVQDIADSPINLARPKLASLAVPCLVTRVLEGLMSRCSSLCWCTWA
eukprot:CAMPEP_0175933260 /NCGR_PEP_ID=MMETSP0108-20121206/19830_1 /TAXON_ID=195067 ORGANISM="Goniomonas pacifica, Strain CCMP1869" /NCGR_SAMPLE_ID=MMETSP0108 /ASSEMBLY_ACC=CAM_ASM_000204 /LENGTH=71 /DNA_ID=CAMNT_0017256957 /DNA_START=10 /DNA_END=222 /DNA_ORIENTATION=+